MVDISGLIQELDESREKLMGSTSSCAGIDVAKDKLDVVLLHNQSRHHAVFENSETGIKKLQGWLKRRCRAAIPVCMEATGHYGDVLAERLHEAGYSVSVVNPSRVKAFAASLLSRQKTDKADAQVIALFCQSQMPEPWTPPDPAQRELRVMVRHLQGLKDIRQQQRNRLGAVVQAPAVIQALQEHLAFLDRQIAQLEQRILDHLNQHPTLKQQRDLLITIPGLGEATIATLLAEIADIRAFDNAPQLAAYAGVTPRQHRSGSSVRRKTHISKQGNARLRAALYFPAMVAIQHNPLLKVFAQRLKAKGHPAKSVIVAVMRKLLHLVYGVLKSGLPFDPHYAHSGLCAS